MNEADLENKLRGLRPADPSPSLEGRVAAALISTRTEPRWWGPWLADRLLWTLGGALAAWLLIPRLPPTAALRVVPPAAPAAPAAAFSEEPLEWSDEGVQLVDGGTAARLLRRVVMERHRSPDGSAELQIPREDVILLPVALR